MKGLNVYIIGLIIVLLNGSFAWITFSWMGRSLTGIVGLAVFFIFMICCHKRNSFSRWGGLLFMIVYLGAFFSLRSDVFFIIVRFFALLPLLSLFLLRKEHLQYVLEKVVDIFTFLVFVSLVLYLMKILMGDFPNLGVSKYGDYVFRNYFYLYLDVFRYDRFCGFTLEPGYYSLLLVLLLLITKFDFKKKRTYLFIISLLLTMSLGGYILGLVGLFLQKIMEKKNITEMLKSLCFLLFILSIVIFVVLHYKGGNNIIVEKIFERLMFDEEYGIVGNNRESMVAEALIDDIFCSNRIWLGIGHNAIAEEMNVQDFDASSWRVFIVEHGAVYTLSYFMLFLMYLSKTSLKKTLPIFVVFWLDFIQHGNLFSESLYFLVIILNINIKTANKVPIVIREECI